MDDCKKLFKDITADNIYSDVEKSTMKYIREHYRFETAADQWIRRAIASWSKTSKKKKKPKESKESKDDDDSDDDETKDLVCSCNKPKSNKATIECDAKLSGCYEVYHCKCVHVDSKALPEIWFCPVCKQKKTKKKEEGNEKRWQLLQTSRRSEDGR